MSLTLVGSRPAPLLTPVVAVSVHGRVASVCPCTTPVNNSGTIRKSISTIRNLRVGGGREIGMCVVPKFDCSLYGNL
jgi:hypothetical protein